MKKDITQLITEYNKKEKALNNLIRNVPKKYWTNDDSKVAQTLRIQMHKLLSDIYKLSEKK